MHYFTIIMFWYYLFGYQNVGHCVLLCDVSENEGYLYGPANICNQAYTKAFNAAASV